ncbi:DNA (cytosine-5-)-methyltransferase [Candidatus Saccharibacteria bacterium]|nr:DNA (cytosine-5-)-methyltransferase [Candidatus Saccharibacteria bacterium]
MVVLSQKIQQFRHLRGMTQKSLSVKSGVTYSTVTKLESGIYTNPTINTIAKISNALDVGVEDLLRETATFDKGQINGQQGKKRGKSKFTFIDLFAGIGGTRIGFERCGGQAVFASEIDKYACQTYQTNFGDYPSGDITRIDANDIPDHDVLVAGFPCQPFSIAGVSKYKSLGLQHGFLNATKGTLFFDIARIVKAKRPKILFLENVKNLMSHDKGRTFEVIKGTLEGLNYRLHFAVHDGRHFVPQHRERTIIVAFNNDVFEGEENFSFPEIPDRQHCLRDILQKKAGSKYTLTDNLWQYLQDYAEKHRKKGNGFGYGLPHLDGISRTLSARYYKDGSEILIRQRGKNPRRLTPRECARLQGFPEDFVIPVSDTQAYRQFGNAVVVPLIEYLAKPLVKTLSHA